MPRNSAGTYSPTTGQPVVASTVISPTVHNALVSDVGAELTDSLSRSGKGAMNAPLRVPDGAVTAPTVAFSNETNTGLYRAGSHDVRLAVNGADALTADATGVDVAADLGVGGAIAVTGAATVGGDLGVTGTIVSAMVPIARARLITQAAGAVQVANGHGIDSASYSGANLTVVISAAAGSPGFVLFSSLGSTAGVPYATSVSGANITVHKPADDAWGVAEGFYLLVF